MIEAVRGGDTRDDDEGDICIDDFVLTIGRCRSELIAPYNPPYFLLNSSIRTLTWRSLSLFDFYTGFSFAKKTKLN